LAIQKLARATGGDVQELLTLYALEGLLARVAASSYRGDLVLKGGVLLAAYSLRRPTKDIDLQATGLTSGIAEVVERIGKIAWLDTGDGLVFDRQTISAHTIREDDEIEGVRVRLVASLGRARLPVGIDVNFGDPIWPAPTEITLPRLVAIGQEPVRMLGYSLPMVIAEKAVTALERGEANTRWRDFADILTIGGVHEISAGELRAALEAVAAYRRVALRPLLPALETMPDLAQPRWTSWRRRQVHASKLPEQFSDALSAIAAFVDPLLRSSLSGDERWSPARQTWELAAN
jgi:hypothetical protein